MSSKGAGSNVDALGCTPGPELDAATLRKAALAVCARATDVEDARELLAALGLVEVPGVSRRWERR